LPAYDLINVRAGVKFDDKWSATLFVYNLTDKRAHLESMFTENELQCAEWFARVKAPKKQLVWFEHSAHMPMTEEPGKYFLSLVRYARPIAERTGDIAS
jgi:pimeloyl-ACP methyl ester carboxylesterase